MIRFACPTCKSVLQSLGQMAGSKIACPQCGQRLLIPNPVKPKSERVARVVSLTLALAMFGLLGWLIWMFPNPLSPQPSEQHSRDNEQLASLAQINPLPLVQEVESSQTDVSAPLSSRTPPPPAPPAAKKRPSDPVPRDESRPPDLPSPVQPANDTPKKKRPPPSTNQGEADLLGKELVKAAAEQQDGLLEKLRQGKGPEYTQALAAAIGQLPDEAKKKARQTLAERLTRFTAKTLLAYLGNENPELRRAAALALGMKAEKDHMSELIDLLEDPEPSVVDAAHAALKKMLTSREAASEEHAEARPARTPGPREQLSPSRQPMPPAKAQPPAGDSQASKSKKEKKDDDVPDVSLVPPEETPSAVKAIIQANALALFSKRASERIQAAQVLGGLGEAGKPARRFLCAAMLDPVIAVRVAAADALKNIDPKMQHLAVMLATEKVATANDVDRLVGLLEKIQKLEEDGEPLVPLVAFVVKFAASNGAYPLFTTALTTLSRIGRNDLFSYRVIATALTNRDAAVRAIALRGLARMKHGKLAVPRILIRLRTDVPANRIAAIETLTALADESTEEIIADAIAAQRYHDDKEIREAVEKALNKLENKKTP